MGKLPWKAFDITEQKLKCTVSQVTGSFYGSMVKQDQHREISIVFGTKSYKYWFCNVVR